MIVTYNPTDDIHLKIEVSEIEYNPGKAAVLSSLIEKSTPEEYPSVEYFVDRVTEYFDDDRKEEITDDLPEFIDITLLDEIVIKDYLALKWKNK